MRAIELRFSAESLDEIRSYVLLLALACEGPPAGLGQHSPATLPARTDWVIRKPAPDWTVAKARGPVGLLRPLPALAT